LFLKVNLKDVRDPQLRLSLLNIQGAFRKQTVGGSCVPRNQGYKFLKFLGGNSEFGHFSELPGRVPHKRWSDFSQSHHGLLANSQRAALEERMPRVAFERPRFECR
jgi:hypothetical protein